MYRAQSNGPEITAPEKGEAGLFDWRKVEARVEYCTPDDPAALQIAAFHTIDHGPDFTELVRMVEAWCASQDVVIWDVTFRVWPEAAYAGRAH